MIIYQLFYFLYQNRQMKANSRNPYSCLDLSIFATPQQIRKAYKKLALKWHPDKNPQNLLRAQQKFREISEAYQILSEQKRKTAQSSTYTNADAQNLFNNFFKTCGFDNVEEEQFFKDFNKNRGKNKRGLVLSSVFKDEDYFSPGIQKMSNLTKLKSPDRIARINRLKQVMKVFDKNNQPEESIRQKEPYSQTQEGSISIKKHKKVRTQFSQKKEFF